VAWKFDLACQDKGSIEKVPGDLATSASAIALIATKFFTLESQQFLTAPQHPQSTCVNSKNLVTNSSRWHSPIDS
jgi:hypothetical protein